MLAGLETRYEVTENLHLRTKCLIVQRFITASRDIPPVIMPTVCSYGLVTTDVRVLLPECCTFMTTVCRILKDPAFIKHKLALYIASLSSFMVNSGG